MFNSNEGPSFITGMNFDSIINNQDCGDIVGHVGLHCVCRYCSPVEYAKHKWQGKPLKHQGCRLSIYILKKTLFFSILKKAKQKREIQTQRDIFKVRKQLPGNFPSSVICLAEFLLSGSLSEIFQFTDFPWKFPFLCSRFSLRQRETPIYE